MSGMWNQGGQPQMAPAPRHTANPPPVCFNCDEKGHFVVHCPHPSRMNNAAFPMPPVPQFQPQPPQPYQAQAGPPQAPYQPQIQYPAQQQVPQNHQYGGPPVQPPYSQVQTPQPYSALPTTAQYGRPGFQPPPYNQNSPPNPQQPYGAPVYQQNPQNLPTPAVPAFQTPQPNYTPQNNTYAGSYGVAPNPQQWNNTPQVSRNVPPQQRPQRSMSQVSQNNQDVFSVAPSPQSYPQVPQPNYQQSGPQHHAPSTAPQLIPNVPQVPTPAVNNQGPVHFARAPVTSSHREGMLHSNAGAPTESVLNSTEKSTKMKETTPTVNLQQPVAIVAESPEPEDEEQQFDWDYKYIFKECGSCEVVSLAQPLAGMLTEMGPVVKVDSNLAESVSRYAKHDNLDDYVKGIRDTSQWEFAQKDPVFADLRQDCPLVPIEEVPSWTARRHGFIDRLEGEGSRKRARANEQDDVHDQTAQEVSEEPTQGHRSTKRQKNEDTVILDEVMTEVVVEQYTHAPGTPCLTTQLSSGSGVEGREIVDDAWAPEPGEVGSISSPADPTEALLASLGVTGEAKPANSEPLPSYTLEEQDKSQGHSPQIDGFEAPPPPPPLPPNQQNLDRQKGLSPMANQQNQMAPVAPQTSPPYAPPTAQYGRNQPPNTPHQNQQHGPQRSVSWSNGPPNNPNFAGPPQNNSANYGPPTTPIYQGGSQAPVAHVSTQYAPQRSASYPNPQFSPPQYNNSPQPNAQFGQGGGPQNGQFYGQQSYVDGQTAQYAAPQYPNQHANNPPQGPPQWVNGQQQYNNAPYGPPQYSNGPQSQQQYGNAPQGQQHYAHGPTMQQPYTTPQGPPQFGNGPPNQQVNGPYQQGQSQYAGHQNQQQFNGYPQGPHQQNSFQQQSGSHTQHGYQGQNVPQQGGLYQQNGFQPQNGAQHNGPNDFQQQNGPQQNGPNQQSGFQQQNGPKQHNGFQQNGPSHQNGYQQHNGPQQNGPSPQNGFQHNGPTENGFQQQNGPPRNQQQMNNVPSRQDSGYMSARGSYSNDSGQSGFRPDPIGQYNQVTQKENKRQGIQNGQQIEEEVEVAEREGSESEPDTPLSPTSAEILGKLVPGDKVKSGKENRRVKRPQPVVAAAYSRRW